MELFAETLHSTMASIKPDVGERRQHQRLPFRFKVKIIPYENQICSDPISVWTRDISAGGIGLIVHKPMRDGSRFIIKLPRHHDTPVLFLCTVRNCARLAANVYGVGATFAEVAESRSALAARSHDGVVPIPFVKDILLGPDLTEEVRRISEAILA
ncbi:MAG TPA: PilZ domain-containing protein [Tepidisphaeraceae bacterium]|jgi:hypothetical protein|nr:PilZ domain-containing protein [Tepidisphaeraceae bacterium]